MYTAIDELTNQNEISVTHFLPLSVMRKMLYNCFRQEAPAERMHEADQCSVLSADLGCLFYNSRVCLQLLYSDYCTYYCLISSSFS